MDHPVLEQIAAINCSAFSTSDNNSILNSKPDTENFNPSLPPPPPPPPPAVLTFLRRNPSYLTLTNTKFCQEKKMLVENHLQEVCWWMMELTDQGFVGSTEELIRQERRC